MDGAQMSNGQNWTSPVENYENEAEIHTFHAITSRHFEDDFTDGSDRWGDEIGLAGG